MDGWKYKGSLLYYQTNADDKQLYPVRPAPESPMDLYVDAINPKITSNILIRPADNYERTLPTRLPPPRPRLPNSSGQASVQQNPLIPRTEKLIPVPPIEEEDEPLYTEIEEPQYLEILPRKDVTFQAQRTSRPEKHSQLDVNFNLYRNRHEEIIQERVNWMKEVSRSSTREL
ncbi:uncharacterized protein LOC144032537 isoform X2 [Festucalex cinctus]